MTDDDYVLDGSGCLGLILAAGLMVFFAALALMASGGC